MFDGLPWSVYLPAPSPLDRSLDRLRSGDLLGAGDGRLPPRVIPPRRVETLTRGKGTNARHIRNILPETAAAESLLVVEVDHAGRPLVELSAAQARSRCAARRILSRGDLLPPPVAAAGLRLQRVYTDDRTLDETLAVADRDVVLVPRGYHPVGAPHGYDLYYLNVMAGPKRTWRFHNDPAHEWLK